MNRTLVSADTAHYYLRSAQLSTLPAARLVHLGADPPAHYGRADRRVPVVPNPGRQRARPAPGLINGRPATHVRGRDP
jgi:hypothetical protein